MLDMCGGDATQQEDLTGLSQSGEPSHTGPQALHCCYEVDVLPAEPRCEADQGGPLQRLRAELQLQQSNRVAVFFAIISALQAVVILSLLLR
jgi:hypothetical protein